MATSITVNTHTLSSNIVISASDLTTGKLPHAQLSTLLSSDIPNNTANTGGNAATATHLAANGTDCPTGQAPTGVDAAGNATGCALIVAAPNIQNSTSGASIPAYSGTPGSNCDPVAAYAAMTGLTTTMTLTHTPTTDISAVVGWGTGGVYFAPWPTAGQLNYRRCNGTSAPISPGVVTWNWSGQGR